MINENRYNALCIYKNVLIELGILTKSHLTGEKKELTPEQKELKEKALMSAALIVLMPSVTGYLAEEHEGGSAAEKLVKLEELTHDFFAGKSRS